MDVNEERILAFAHQVGLSKAANGFKEDLLAAAVAASSFRKGLGSVPDTTSEPWPPMRTARRP